MTDHRNVDERRSQATPQQQKSAERTFRQLRKETLRLNPEDQQRFAEALVDPPPLNDAMTKAQEWHDRLIDKPRD